MSYTVACYDQYGLTSILGNIGIFSLAFPAEVPKVQCCERHLIGYISAQTVET